MKKTFLKYDKPLLTVMVEKERPEEAINTITKALENGAEAFGVQLCYLKKEYRNEKDIKRIFEACGDKPIYITAYPIANSESDSYEECAELLLLGLSCGATICDVMGDFYHKEPHELTFDTDAVQKQIALIEKIHALGGEVLMSSHLHAFFEEEKIVEYAKEHIRRGADLVKIVSIASTEEEMLADLKICARLKTELDKPFLFLANGKHCRPLRQMGAALGVCMYLCQYSCEEHSSTEQPLLSTAKYIRDTVLFK